MAIVDTLFAVDERPAVRQAPAMTGATVEVVKLADLRPGTTVAVRSEDRTVLLLRMGRARGELRSAQLLVKEADSVEIADDSDEPPVCGEWQGALLRRSNEIRVGGSLSVWVTPLHHRPYTLSLGRVAELRVSD